MDEVDVDRVVDGLLFLYGQNSVLFDKLRVNSQKIKDLRALVSEETLKKKGI